MEVRCRGGGEEEKGGEGRLEVRYEKEEERGGRGLVR